MDKSMLSMMRIFLFAAVTLLGGTYFPLTSMVVPLKITLLISFFLFYGVMGNLMHRIYGPGKSWTLFLLTLAFTTLGLVGRYFLDADMVAAYTPENILSFLVVIPVYTTLAYKLLPRS